MALQDRLLTADPAFCFGVGFLLANARWSSPMLVRFRPAQARRC